MRKHSTSSVWSISDYTNFSVQSAKFVSNLLEGYGDIKTGSAEALCLTVLLSLGGFPGNLETGCEQGVMTEAIVDDLIDRDWMGVELHEPSGKWDWFVKTPPGAFHSVSLSGRRTDREVSKLRHDMVPMALGCNSTDVRLDAIFPKANITENYEALTPDVHVRIGNCNFIIEVTTTRSPDPSAGYIAYASKRAKYTDALTQVDQSEPCILIVLVVSDNYVLSSYPIDQDLAEKLIYFMKVGCVFEDMVEESGNLLIATPGDSERDHLAQTLTKTFTSIKIEERDEVLDSVLDITKEFIDSLSVEPDINLVNKYFMRSVAASVQEIIAKAKDKTPPGKDPRVEGYLSFLKNQVSKDSMKPCVGFPLVSVRREADFNAEVEFHLITGPEDTRPIIKLWNGAFAGYKNYDYDFLCKLNKQVNDAYCTNPAEQEVIEKANKEFRNKAHRCAVSDVLTEQERELLALDGIWAKRFRNSELKKVKEGMAKRPFNLDTDTEDIASFLLNKELLKPCSTGPMDLLTLKLIRDSMERLGQKTRTLDWVEEWVNTKAFSALEFMSDAAIEVAVSMKQNVSANQMILKKLGHYNVYLLILPTKSSEHIFYSMYFPSSTVVEKLVGLPFREMNELSNGGFYTDFWSMRRDTLANPSTISSAFLGLASYWSYHYRLDNFSPANFAQNGNAVAMLNLSTLVRLENKAKTEEAITISRYMFMEIFKGNTVLKPDPFRMVSKFNECPRSRLELFIYKRLITSFYLMMETPPVRVAPPTDDGLEDDAEEDVRNNDTWKYLRNPYTNGYEESASRVVNLFYIGYAVDKDKIAQKNSDYATIQKAITKDREFDIGEYERSNGSKDDFEEFPKEKQFSINALKHGVGLMANKLKRTLGQEFKRRLQVKVIDAMCKHMTEEVATLKASSSEECKTWEELDTAQESLTKKKYRTKVITALLHNIQLFENNVFKRFKELVELIEMSSRGVLSDLFKKNQHGGLREIYVLNILSRVISLFLETCARVICSEFDCETMTHPDRKTSVFESHKIRVASRSEETGRDHSEFHCSADKKSWNNNLVMPALSVTLFSLLPETMHGTIQRCLNMWNKRLLKIPDGVLKLLVDGTVLKCQTYQDMLKEYDEPAPREVKGKRPPIFAAPKSAFIRLTTGMMQGILHYTSSLAHVAFLYSSADMMRKWIVAKCPGSEHKISQMVSSDDSATIISILHPKNASDETKLVNRIWGEALCLSLTKYCSFFCFTNSDKSVMGAPGHIEFNSEFIFGNTLAMPVLKWVLACFGVTESDSFLNRYNTMYNLMSQANSSGLPACNTTMVQIAQGLLAYKLIGHGTSPHFTTYAEYIKLYPDPLRGYFVIDNIHVPGMLGFGYHHWATVKPLGIYKIKSSSIAAGTLSFTPEGGLMENFLLRHGKSERYIKMMEEMGDGLDIAELREKVNTKPECLYKPSYCTEDAEIKLIAKALLPGTAQSLGRGNPFLQALSSSIYCLHTFCFTRYESCFIGTKLERSSTKISLLCELRERVLSLGKVQEVTIDNSESIAFPDCEKYKSYWTVLKPFNDSRLVKVRPMRYRKTNMYLPHATSHIAIPLIDLCKEKWVGIRHFHSRMLANRCWDEYRKLMPWLSDTLIDTLEKSQFSDHIELHNFVNTASKSLRKFTRVGPSVKSTFIESQISQVARRTHLEGHILVLPGTKAGYFRSFRDRRSAMSMALEIPIRGAREEAISEVLQSHAVQENELVHMRDKARRESMLNIIMAKLILNDDRDVTRMIMDMGGGLLITWISEQKKSVKIDESTRSVTSKWRGPGNLVLCNHEVILRVYALDGEITKIETSSINETKKIFFALRSALRSQGLRASNMNAAASAFYTEKEVSVIGPGTPIVEVNDVSYRIIPNLDNVKYKVENDQGELRLVQEGIGKPSTVLQYKVLAHEMDPFPNTTEGKSVWKTWLNQRVLEKSIAFKFIEDSYERIMGEMKHGDNTSASYNEAMGLKRFLQVAITSRLRCKGYITNATIKGPLRDEDHDLAGTEISGLRSSVLNAATQAMRDEAVAYAKEAEMGINDMVTSVMMDHIHYHKDELDQNPGIMDGMAMEELADPSVGNFCLPPFSEYISLFTGTKTLVEYTTARLSNLYSVLPFFDSMIRSVCDVNSRAWTYISQRMVVPGVPIPQELIFFVTGSVSNAGVRRVELNLDADVLMQSKLAVYHNSMAEFSMSRVSLEAVSDVQRRRALFEKKMEKDLNSDRIMTKQEIISLALSHFDEVTASERGSVRNLDRNGLDVPLAITERPIERIEDWADAVESASQIGEPEADQELEEYGLAPIERPTIPFPSEEVVKNIKSLLTSDEVEYMYKILRWKLSAHHWPDSLLPMILQMRNAVGDFRFNINDIHVVPIYFGPLGFNARAGHWVTAVSGMKKGTIEIYDGVNSEHNISEAYDQLREIYPELRREQVVGVPVQLQPENACGHVSLLHATHRVLNLRIDHYDKEGLATWVLACLVMTDIISYLKETVAS